MKLKTWKSKYKVIYADPPWHFKSYSSKGDGRNATQHYDCMSISDICKLPVDRISDNDCVLLMWVVDPMFTGLGYWTRSNPEMCLLATKGKPSRLSKSVRQLIHSPRREHSRKPDEIYDRIEQLLPGPYVELFARRERKGWDSWGNEL